MTDVFVPSMDGVTLGEHTADVWLEVFGSSIGQCAMRALQGLYSVMAEEFRITSSVRDSIVLRSKDDEFLIIDILSEALFLFDSENSLILDPAIKRQGEDSWIMDFSRSKCNIPEGKGGMEVKAATFHGTGIFQKDGKWFSRVLLDL